MDQGKDSQSIHKGEESEREEYNEIKSETQQGRH